MTLLKYRIKEIREKLGMSQTELSRKSGISRATIWAIESGDEHISTIKTLMKIADALGTTLDALFAQEG